MSIDRPSQTEAELLPAEKTPPNKGNNIDLYIDIL